MVTGKLAGEIRQTQPFRSVEGEAILNIQRTASVLEQALVEALRPSGLSPTQYNVLRILRGAGEAGLACQEIAERMVARDPDITRLLDRLEVRSLVGRARSGKDRRVVLVRLTGSGAALVGGLDEHVEALPGRLLGHMGERRVRALIDLLELARAQA
jgi:DNA-binding MarR family transcriptional regulator